MYISWQTFIFMPRKIISYNVNIGGYNYACTKRSPAAHILFSLFDFFNCSAFCIPH